MAHERNLPVPGIYPDEIHWEIELQENDGKLEIWRSDTVGFEMGILFEFVPANSDLPKEMVKNFAEQLVKWWNSRYA